MAGGNRILIMATQLTPTNRRSGESRNPETSVAGTLFSRRISWIPAFAGTTVLCCDCLELPRQGRGKIRNPLILSLSKDKRVVRQAHHERLHWGQILRSP